MLLNETRLKPQNKLKIKNYVIYRSDRANANGGGVAILIRSNIPHAPVQIIAGAVENISIKLHSGIIITSLYNPPRNILSQPQLDLFFSLAPKQLVIGDYNARHQTWGNHRANRNGNALYDYAANNNIAILDPDTPTHYPANGTTPTTIDLILNKQILTPISPSVYPEMDSDHLPVMFDLNDNSRQTNAQATYVYTNTNWNKYRQILNNTTKITGILHTREDIDTAIKDFTNTIQHARNCVAKKVIAQPQEERLPEDILKLIAFKNKILQTWHRHRRQTDRQRAKALTQTINERIRTHRNEVWQARLQTLTPRDNSLWQLSRALRKTRENIPTLTHNNTDHMTDAAKAQCLADFYETVYTTPPDATDVQRHITETYMTSYNEQTLLTQQQITDLIISPQELLHILKTLPPKKSPGPDSIQNILLKNLPKKSLIQFTHIINSILSTQYFPTSWKLATVIPIPKPGKPPLYPSSYRPISLLSSMSKVVERVILTKLSHIITENQLIPNIQFGFKKGGSTTHAAARLVHDILLNFKHHKNTTLILLDMERAFDSVWHPGLLYKLQHVHHIPSHFLNLLKSYLSDRYFQVRVNSSLSPPHPINAGVPQGTVLAPTLYSLYTSDVPTSPHTQLLLYADDTALYSSSYYAQVAGRRLKMHLPILEDYFTQWKLRINPTKTERITFTKKFTNNNIFEPITILNKPITDKKAIKYLGITIDKRVSFQQHISSAISKTIAASHKLYPLLAKNNFLTVANKVLLYKTTLRPILAYGCPVWQSTSPTQRHRLHRIQNKLLRLATNSDRYIKITELHQTAQTQFISDYIDEISQKFYTRQIHNSPLTTHIADIRYNHNLYPKHKLIHEGLPIYNTLLG